MLKLVGSVAAVALLWQTAGAAHASTVTYDLTLSGGFSGTGTLTFTDGPVDTSALQFNVDPADITTLTFTIGGLTFDPLTNPPGFGVTTVAWQGGNFWDITFGWTFDTTNSEELIANATTATLFNITTRDQTYATITAQLQSPAQPIAATPLPAALPLLAGGIGIISLFGARRRRNALAA
jgi:hypothetical protein